MPENFTTSVVVALSAAMTIAQASARKFEYPAIGRAPEQQNCDEAACFPWADRHLQAAFAMARGARLEGRGCAVE
jgi:hypothetical protein